MTTFGYPMATFYTNSGYSGTKLTLYTGSPRINNLLLATPNVDLAISSITVNNGYLIFVYTGVNCTGTSWVFRGPIDVDNLENYGINDQIQSLLGTDVDTTAPGITLFQGSNQSGLSYYFPTGVYNLANYPIKANTASSVIIYGFSEAVLSGTDGDQVFTNHVTTGTPDSVKNKDNATSLTVASLNTSR